MKLFLVIFLIVLVSGLNIRNETNQTQEETQLMEKHEQVLETIATVYQLANFLKAQFTMTCGKGYIRGANVNILNKLPTSITSLGHYEDYGKVLEYGDQQIRKGKYSKYYFVKGSYRTSGTSGLFAWKLSNTDMLVVFYENPFNSWNFEGACIYQNQKLPVQKFQNLPQETLKKYFLDLEKRHQKWPSNCKELDNTEQQDTSWFTKASLRVGPYLLQFIGKYEQTNQFTASCYVMELDISVTKV